MATQVSVLMDRLRSPEFRQKLLTLCDSVTSMATQLYSGDAREFAELEGDWPSSLELAMNACGAIWDVINEPAQSLGKPPVILPGELWQEFEVYFGEERYGFSDEDFDAYLDHIQHRLLRMRSSEPFAVCEISFPESDAMQNSVLRGLLHGVLLTESRLLGNVTDAEIQESAARLTTTPGQPMPQIRASLGDFRLTFHKIEFKAIERHLRKPHLDGAIQGTLLVELSGRASDRAMRHLALEVAALARSHFDSVKYLEGTLSPETFTKYLPFGMRGLEIAILNTSNKDTFERRIANAILLLSESDKQHSDAIGLSLCVTAIDALLGRKGQELTKTLSDFVAGLLEPDVQRRRKAADYVSDLYDKRSRVLHGDRLDGTPGTRDEARWLAASVLFGVWSYKDFFERFYSNTPRPDEFFTNLRSEFVKPGLPEGVLELPVRKLWCS